MNKCSKCGAIISDKDNMAWKCMSCGKAFKVNLSKLKQVQAQKDKPENTGKMLLKCPACGNGMDDGNEKIACKCSACGNVSGGNLKYFVSEEKVKEKQSAYTHSARSSLIKCPECGREISDTIEQCIHCGYRIKRKNQINKKLIIVSVAIVFIVCSIFAVKIISNLGNPANQAIKIIEADYGKDINITAVYYNEEQNGCIIEFSSRGMPDVACVHLADQSIGYESIYEELSEKTNDTSLSNEEKQKYAAQIIEYSYDAFWVYDLFMNGTNGSGWEKVQ